VENIQREDLDPIETALSFQRLIDECQLTQEAMALRVGKKRATITNSLRLLKLPEEMQQALKLGKISVGHAKVLLGVEDPALQHKLFDQTVRNGWSVRRLEEAAQEKPLKAKEKPADETDLPAVFQTLKERMGRHFAGHVAVRPDSKGGGTITIRYDNPEQIETFLQSFNPEL
jgi:ParB family chromosome partitioning protein